MPTSFALLTLLLGIASTPGAFAAHNPSYSKKVANASPASKSCGWTGSTNVHGGFSYSSLGYQFPQVTGGATYLRSTLLECSGPKVSLEQTVGYKEVFNLSVRGSFTDIYVAAAFRQLAFKGYIATAEGRLFVPFLLNRSAQMHLSIMGGFGWRQTYAHSDPVATSAGASNDDVINHKVRYLSPLAGLFLDFCPSEKSYANFGMTFLFPRARQRGLDLTTGSSVTDHLRVRRHGWTAECEYRYKLSRHLSILASMQYTQIQVYGNLYNRFSETNEGRCRSFVYERDVAGVVGLCINY